jgi:hypothetical protein
MQIQTLKRSFGAVELFTIKEFFSLSASIKSHDQISWSISDGDILAVDWADLGRCTSIPWKDVNLVVTETFQQVVDAINLFDTTRSYILVTESYADPAVVKSALPTLKIIDTFTRFVEVFEYGRSMFNPVHQFIWAQDFKREPKYDLFSLMGRTSKSRSYLIQQLSKFDLENSLVKYNGKQHPKSKAPDLDPINYNVDLFYSSNNTFADTPWLIPAKIIPTALYQQFYFEVQHETDPYNGGNGWQIAEFHLSEKTIKPLIMGVPCLMLGAVGYNTWLLESFGIDLSLGQFDMDFDKIKDNATRTHSMVRQLPELIKNKVSLNTQHQHAKNLLGFNKLRDFNLQQYRNLYNLVSSL